MPHFRVIACIYVKNRKDMYELSPEPLEDSVTQSDQLSPPEKPIYVIKVGGYLDMITAEALDQAILSVTKSGQFNIIIDLTDAEYIASMGWSIFLNHIKKLRDNHGDLKLANMNDGVFEVYKVLEFFWFMNAYQTIEEAVTAFDENQLGVIHDESPYS